MKKEVKYILNDEEITCIGDIRRVKANIEIILSNTDKWSKEDLIKQMETFNRELRFALEKLEIVT